MHQPTPTRTRTHSQTRIQTRKPQTSAAYTPLWLGQDSSCRDQSPERTTLSKTADVLSHVFLQGMFHLHASLAHHCVHGTFAARSEGADLPPSLLHLVAELLDLGRGHVREKLWQQVPFPAHGTTPDRVNHRRPGRRASGRRLSRAINRASWAQGMTLDRGKINRIFIYHEMQSDGKGGATSRLARRDPDLGVDLTSRIAHVAGDCTTNAAKAARPRYRH